MSHLTICLIICVLTMISYVIGKLPMGLTAMLSMVAFVITGCLKQETALSYFGNANGVMMNRTVMIIFIPIAILACKAMGANPVGIIILVQVACLSSFMTPMATPAIPMCMASGGYDIKSLIRQSLPGLRRAFGFPSPINMIFSSIS